MKHPLLMSVAAAVSVLAAGGHADVTSNARTSGIMLRVAFMMGSRGDVSLPVATASTTDPGAFGGWDPTADNPELQNLLGLKEMAEISRASVTLPPEENYVRLSVVAAQRRYEFVVEPAEQQADVVYMNLKVTEDGKDLSQPRMGLALGQKGVVCARVARDAGEAFVFVVLQLDETS
jgi:hypothetical protein